MNLKKKLLLWTLLSVVFLLAALSVQYISGIHDNDIASKKDKVEKTIRHKEWSLKEISKQILRSNPDSLSFTTIQQKIPGNLWEDDGLILFIYKNDSLIFWSDNSVPAPDLKQAKLADKSFFHYANGWFSVMADHQDLYEILGLILIKYDYPYQNEYLKNDFQRNFNLDPEIRLDTIPGNINIHDPAGNYIFSLGFPDSSNHQCRFDFLVYCLLAAAWIAFITLLFYLYHLFEFFRNRPLWLFLAFMADALILRLIILIAKVPGFLYRTDLFSPYYYATSFISPSLGDLVTNSFVWLLLAWLFYKKIDIDLAAFSKKVKVALGFLMMMISGSLFYLLMSTMRRMVIDSSFELDLNNIFNIDIYSGLAFVALTCQYLAFFFVTAKLTCSICRSKLSPRIYIVLAILTSLLIIPVFIREGSALLNFLYPSLFFAYLLSFLYFAGKEPGFRSISGALFYIVFFSLIGTFVLDYFQEKKEMDKRKIMVTELSSKRDPMMEYEYERLNPDLLGDSLLKDMIAARDTNKALEANLTEYLKKKYFNGLWGNYEQLITVCNDGEILEIQPAGYLMNCYEYFNEMLNANKADSVANGLFFFNNRSENNNYVAVFEFPDDSRRHERATRIFVELYYKYIKETGLGYPDLLIDKKVKMISGLSDYSYARYYQGALVYKYGDFSYRLALLPLFPVKTSPYFIDQDGYSHLVSRSDEDNVLIISKKNAGLLDLIAPFSYLFILFSLSLVAFLLLVMLPVRHRKIEFNFSNQLQLSIILIIVISFFILGVITRARIIHMNNDKNTDILSEKTFSVLTELEHKIGDEDHVTPEMTGYLKDQLYKFSTIFYSDINLYDPQGNLIVSSRPQIFEEELLSGKMHTEAFRQLAFEQNLLYIQNERIGLQEYLSAYIPFRNNKDKVIAYLNLPYFAKQTEIRKELSDFLVAYINVYVLLIVLAIMVTIIVSRLVTRPLQLIREKLGRVELGKANEKIEWVRRDEIGDLVEEYNRMVDELARSAELLASSERESAWREMAKQVAHEIKNPLTPMKLSVQYLKKAWDEKASDWENRLDRFSRTIIEQIDSLSQIASEFSDFAKMPVANLEKIELTSIVKDAVNLYHDIDSVQFIENYSQVEHFVKADKRQLLRVFNNLIQNAVQAIGDRPDGRIGITITESDALHIIEISDNGVGITKEQAAHMFTPSFTTKSSGMGLGLAMVKSILTSIGGTITFTSREGDGTTFTLEIPSFSDD